MEYLRGAGGLVLQYYKMGEVYEVEKLDSSEVNECPIKHDFDNNGFAILITIFANSGAGSVYVVSVLSAVKLYYKRALTFLPALIVMLTTQVLFPCFFF